jgi:hypothetical protein
VAAEDAAAVEVGASLIVAGPNQRPKLRLAPVLPQNALEIHISAAVEDLVMVAAEDSATDTDGPIVAAGPRLRVVDDANPDY